MVLTLLLVIIFTGCHVGQEVLTPLPIQEITDHNGSGGGTNCGNFTFPPAYHHPVDSPLYFTILINDCHFPNCYWCVGTIIYFLIILECISFQHHITTAPAESLKIILSWSLLYLMCTNSFNSKVSASFSITLEHNHDVPIRLLSFSVSWCSSVWLARYVARRTFNCLRWPKSDRLLLDIVSPLSTNY